MYNITEKSMTNVQSSINVRLLMVSGCLTKADVVLMVDSSTSVGSTNFQKLEHFLKVTATSLTG